MAEKKPKTIRLPNPETERIEEMADRRGMSEADMYRRLIRTGLEAETDLTITEKMVYLTRVAWGAIQGLIVAALLAVAMAVVVPNAAGTLVSFGQSALSAAFVAFAAIIGANITIARMRKSKDDVGYLQQLHEMLSGRPEATEEVAANE